MDGQGPPNSPPLKEKDTSSEKTHQSTQDKPIHPSGEKGSPSTLLPSSSTDTTQQNAGSQATGNVSTKNKPGRPRSEFCSQADISSETQRYFVDTIRNLIQKHGGRADPAHRVAFLYEFRNSFTPESLFHPDLLTPPTFYRSLRQLFLDYGIPLATSGEPRGLNSMIIARSIFTSDESREYLEKSYAGHKACSARSGHRKEQSHKFSKPHARAFRFRKFLRVIFRPRISISFDQTRFHVHHLQTNLRSPPFCRH